MGVIYTLTNSLLQRRLQIASACAAQKGYELVQKKNRGIPCAKDEKKVQLTLDLVDSLTEYISFIGGEYGIAITQDSDPDGLEWEPTDGGSGSIAIMDTDTNLCIGIADYTTDFETTMAMLLNSINTHTEHGTVFTNPWGDNTNEYYATYVDGIFTVFPPAGSTTDKNGKEVFFAYQGGSWGGIGNGQTFSGGEDGNMDTEIDDADTCLSNEEIILILDKLCQLCGAPCQTYVNFESLNN